jgi:hypothetical protein
MEGFQSVINSSLSLHTRTCTHVHYRLWVHNAREQGTMAISYFSMFSALTILYGIFKLFRFGRREKHLPPGPPTYPIVGNAHLAVDKDLYKRSVFCFSIL